MTAHAREHEVEQDQARKKTLHVLPSAMAVNGQRSGEMGLAQSAVEQRGVERFVFYDLDDGV